MVDVRRKQGQEDFSFGDPEAGLRLARNNLYTNPEHSQKILVDLIEHAPFEVAREAGYIFREGFGAIRVTKIPDFFVIEYITAKGKYRREHLATDLLNGGQPEHFYNLRDNAEQVGCKLQGAVDYAALASTLGKKIETQGLDENEADLATVLRNDVTKKYFILGSQVFYQQSTCREPDAFLENQPGDERIRLEDPKNPFFSHLAGEILFKGMQTLFGVESVTMRYLLLNRSLERGVCVSKDPNKKLCMDFSIGGHLGGADYFGHGRAWMLERERNLFMRGLMQYS